MSGHYKVSDSWPKIRPVADPYDLYDRRRRISLGTLLKPLERFVNWVLAAFFVHAPRTVHIYNHRSKPASNEMLLAYLTPTIEKLGEGIPPWLVRHAGTLVIVLALTLLILTH